MIANFFAPVWAKILSGALLVALVGAGIQTYRVGYWKRTAITLRLDLDKIKLAQELAAERAEAARKATETQYRTIAERTSNEHAKALSDARAVAQRYIDRMRSQAPQGLPGRASETGEGPGAGLPDEAPGGTVMVAVPERDIIIATDNYIYAQQAHEWVKSLVANGLAEPAQSR